MRPSLVGATWGHMTEHCLYPRGLAKVQNLGQY